LLDLGEEVLGVFVERHAADGEQRELVLGPALRVVERVEIELGMVPVRHDLDAEFPFRVIAALDGVVEVAGGVADILGLDRLGLRARQVTHALLRLPVELDE
jgi:hypothetical protein